MPVFIDPDAFRWNNEISIQVTEMNKIRLGNINFMAFSIKLEIKSKKLLFENSAR